MAVSSAASSVTPVGLSPMTLQRARYNNHSAILLQIGDKRLSQFWQSGSTFGINSFHYGA